MSEAWDTMRKDFAKLDPQKAFIKYVDRKLRYASLAVQRDILDNREKQKAHLARQEIVDLENTTLMEIDNLRVEKNLIQAESDNDEEEVKISIVEETTPMNPDLEQYDAHFNQFPDDEKPLLAQFKIGGRNLVKLAARNGKTPQRWGQIAREAAERMKTSTDFKKKPS